MLVENSHFSQVTGVKEYENSKQLCSFPSFKISDTRHIKTSFVMSGIRRPQRQDIYQSQCAGMAGYSANALKLCLAFIRTVLGQAIIYCTSIILYFF